MLLPAQERRKKMSEKKDKVETATVGAVLPAELKELVTNTARAYGTTASEIVRRAVEAYFAERPDVVAAVSGMPALPEL